MAMTRRDFQAIAEIVRKYHTEGTVDKLILRDMVDKISSYCKESNQSFDKGKFIRACGFYNEY